MLRILSLFLAGVIGISAFISPAFSVWDVKSDTWVAADAIS